MAAKLWLQVEVMGCPTVCRHCWAQGTPYPAMPVADVAWVLNQTHRFCDNHAISFGAYPMHELAAHPQTAQVLRLFADHVGAAAFEPLATTGVPLAVHQDWQQVLAAAASLGTTTVWVAFHGLGSEHDRQVNRPGAFTEDCLAIQRVHAVGLRAGANVLLTTANAGQADRLLEALSGWLVSRAAGQPAGRWRGAGAGRRARPGRARPEALWFGPARCQRLPSWPPGMATAVGKACTSARSRSATCGWTGPSQPDVLPPSPARMEPTSPPR